MNEQPSVLDVRKLAGGPGQATILSDIDLVVPRGQIVGVVGKRGAGKRQLLELIAGLRPSTNGRILLESQDITTLSPRRRQSHGLECSLYVDPVFTRLWTALHHPTLINCLAHKARHVGRSAHHPREEARGWIERLGLSSMGDLRTNELSAGTNNRFELAKMLISRPSVVLWDEPFRAIDYVIRLSFEALIKHVVTTFGISFLISDRSGRYGRLFDTTYFLDRGQVRMAGKSPSVPVDSQVRFGQIFISYSRQDADAAGHFEELLKLVGASPWVDTSRIVTGAQFDSSIEEAINCSSAVLALMSPHSVQSGWVRNELAFADDQGIRILPILVEQCEVPLRLRSMQYIDWRDKFMRPMEEQRDALTSALSGTAP